MGDLVSRSEMARRIGVSESAVRKHIRLGLYGPNRDGLLDFEKCKALLEMHRDPDAAIKGAMSAAATHEANGTAPPATGTAIPESSLSRVRVAHAGLQAQRTKLALEKERGALIKTKDAYAACRAVITLVCERLDGVPGQIAQRIVGLDAVAAERVAREAINGVRAEIAKLTDAVQEISGGNNRA